MKTRKFAALASAMAVLTLTACGGEDEEAAGTKSSGDDWSTPVDGEPPASDPSTEPSAEPDEDAPWPCSLVPADVVSEIYGTEATLTSQEPMVDGGSPQCLYDTESSQVGFYIFDLTKTPIAPTTAEQALDLASGGGDLTMVEGIGELAGYQDGTLATMYVANPKGGSYEVALVTGSPEERDQLISLAGELAAAW
jgi:hypothetical protein